MAQADQRLPEQQREVPESASDSYEAAVLGHRLPVCVRLGNNEKHETNHNLLPWCKLWVGRTSWQRNVRPMWSCPPFSPETTRSGTGLVWELFSSLDEPGVIFVRSTGCTAASSCYSISAKSYEISLLMGRQNKSILTWAAFDCRIANLSLCHTRNTTLLILGCVGFCSAAAVLCAHERLANETPPTSEAKIARGADSREFGTGRVACL